MRKGPRLRKKGWIDLPVTEVEAEVWRLRFSRAELLTIAEIAKKSGHGGASGLLLTALRRLKSRNEDHPFTPEEKELVELALSLTGGSDLEDAYDKRSLEVIHVKRYQQHRAFHE